MKLIEVLNKSSILILVTNKINNSIISSGRGFFINYNDKLLICSLAHITDFKKTNRLIKTNNNKNNKGEHEYFNLGSMVYYDYFNKDNEQLIFDERIDFTFEKISHPKIKKEILKQYVIFNIEHSEKPINTKKYFFRGSKKHEIKNDTYTSIGHFEFNMKYINFVENYYIFKVTETIEDKYNYKGCSGSPVFEETGKLVGIVSEVIPKTKFIKVFPIIKAKKLINKAINDNLI